MLNAYFLATTILNRIFSCCEDLFCIRQKNLSQYLPLILLREMEIFQSYFKTIEYLEKPENEKYLNTLHNLKR